MRFRHLPYSRFGIGLGVVCLTALAALLDAWGRSAERQASVTATELRGLKSQWSTTSLRLTEARKARVAFDAYTEQATRVLRESDRRCWSSALQGIVASTNECIDLRDVRARPLPHDAESWSLRIAGFSHGAAPRIEADTFRRRIEQELKEAFGGEAVTRFERIEDLSEPGSGSPAGGRTGFTIEAKVTRAEHPPAKIAKGT